MRRICESDVKRRKKTGDLGGRICVAYATQVAGVVGVYSNIAYAKHMRVSCGSCCSRIPQVDGHCLDPTRALPLAKEWSRLALDAEGKYELQMLPPALAIAVLLFHPLNWPNMWRKAEAQFTTDGDRKYGHPFTCEELEGAQEELEELLQELGLDDDQEVIDILVGLAMGKDKTDVERMRSADALHIKLLNTGLKEWHQRQSKIMGALSPS